LRRPRSGTPGLIAGLIVVIGVAAIWWFGGRSPESDNKTIKQSNHSLIAEVKPQIVTNAETEVVQVNMPETKIEWREEYMKSTEMRLKFGTLLHSRTNDTGMVIERYRLPNGQTWRRMVDPPPIFENRCDQAIMLALGDASGAPIPPVPGLDDADLDEEFKQGFLSPITINDDDKPEVVALKLAVKETRSEIARMIKDGDTRSVGEILQEHIELNNHMAKMHAEALQQIEKVRKAEGEEFAAEYRTKVNESFKEYGIQPLTGGEDNDEKEDDE